MRFRGDSYTLHGEIEGLGNVHCVMSAPLRVFARDPQPLFGAGATLPMTRGRVAQFTGPVEFISRR